MDTKRQKRFEKVIRQYGDMILRIAWLHTRNDMDAQDIVQEVFLKYSRVKKIFESSEHEKSWLVRVTINKCLDLKKSAWSVRTTSLDEKTVKAFEYNTDEYDICDAVKNLPQKYRNVIHLFYFEGYSVKEIADITDCTEAAVKMQLLRARVKLKDMMKGDMDYAV
ncbi:MAG: sigma-70 family RNA polymerase sigma factor [Oscillospiraceae bacterium]|nr:sigma-70 family RNA polymerase sigma factor [Oscillospiraceae bacterium]